MNKGWLSPFCFDSEAWWYKTLSLAVVYFITLPILSQEGRVASTQRAELESVSKQHREYLTFMTPAYRDAALILLIREANRVAHELRLSEKLPITRGDILDFYISPPRLSQLLGTFGSVTTSNYDYFVSISNKFSFLVKKDLEASRISLQRAYSWPMSRVDTNGAFQLATQYLNAASIDVKALQHECILSISACTPQGERGEYFVPIYWIVWAPKQLGAEKNGASIELVAPTKEIRQLHVLGSGYILRKPLCVGNADLLLSATNRTNNVRR